MTTPRTYSQQVVLALKQMLLDGKLSPGDRVNEVALSTDLGVSRAPVREALHMLVAEGLVVNRPQRGKFITSLSPDEIRNSYFVGGVLEGAAAAACAQCFDDRDFARLTEVVAQMRRSVELGFGIHALAPLDTDFHGIIFSRINNPLLVEVSRHSCLRVSKFLYYRHWLSAYTPDEFCQRHQVVLEALRGRDARHIETVLREHYQDSGQRLAPFGCAAE